MIVGVPIAWGQVVEPSGDRVARRGTGEELRQTFAVEVDEDAADGEREEVRAQQAACVDDAQQGLAGAAACGEAARRDAAEHIGEQFLGQHLCQIHLDGRRRLKSWVGTVE